MERCRFCNCMKLREFCENIFDNKQTNPTIPAIVELFTNLKIVENDPYTKFICSNCFHILIVFYKYRERVLETNQLLQNEIENKQDNVEDFHKKWPRIEQNDGQFVVYTPNFVDDYNTNLRIGNGGNNNDKDNQQLDKSNLCTEKSVSFIKNEIDMEGICVKIENDINDDEDQNIYENNHHLSIPFGDYDDNKTIINDDQINDNKDADIINDESRIEEFPSAIENDSDNEDNQCLNSLIGDDKKITNNDKLYSRIVAGSNKYPGILKNNQFPNESVSNNNNNSSDKDNNEIINVQHTIRKLYQCNICDKKLTQRAHLKRHLIQHSGERPYPCTICDKKFVRNEHLRLHLKIHTGERPYQCTICDKKFIRKEYLKRHSIQQHTN